eukprot:1400843-Rhodomonas_salina.2
MRVGGRGVLVDDRFERTCLLLHATVSPELAPHGPRPGRSAYPASGHSTGSSSRARRLTSIKAEVKEGIFAAIAALSQRKIMAAARMGRQK